MITENLREKINLSTTIRAYQSSNYRTYYEINT